MQPYSELGMTRSSVERSSLGRWLLWICSSLSTWAESQYSADCLQHRSGFIASRSARVTITLLPCGFADSAATRSASFAEALPLRRREKKPAAPPRPPLRGGEPGFRTPRGGDGGGDLPAGPVLCSPVGATDCLISPHL